MFAMQCNQDAGGLFEKVLWLCLLLIDISGSLEILDNISVILPTKNSDTDTSLSFSSRTSPWYSKRVFFYLITNKTSLSLSVSLKFLHSIELR